MSQPLDPLQKAWADAMVDLLDHMARWDEFLGDTAQHGLAFALTKGKHQPTDEHQARSGDDA